MSYSNFLLAILLVSFTIFIACISTKSTKPEDSEKILFGSYGGFAGTHTEYMLLKDGRLYKKNRLGQDYNLLDPLKKVNTLQYFDIIDKISNKSNQINNPGNMTYFLRYEGGENSNEWVWGGTGEQPISTIKILHANLTKSCTNRNPVM